MDGLIVRWMDGWISIVTIESFVIFSLSDQPIMARCLFQTRGAMTLLFVSVFCYMVLVHNCRFVPRDCPEQCECSSCWPILHCDGRNVTHLNFSQSLTWVRIFSVSHTSIPDLQMGTLTLPTIAGVGSLEMIANGITTLTEELFAMNYSRSSQFHYSKTNSPLSQLV